MSRNNQKSPFLQKVQGIIRARQLSYSTEKNYLGWVKRFILWSGKRHPENMGLTEVESYLAYLAVEKQVSAATQNQALNALVFLYRHCVKRELGELKGVPRAQRPRNLPTVLTKEEVKSVLGELRGDAWLVANMLYGAGLRISECLRLRIKDVELSKRQFIVRKSKGYRDRVAILPEKIVPHLERQIEKVACIFRSDRVKALSGVSIPPALGRKYPKLSTSLGWYYIFPAQRYSTDPRTGAMFRHHLLSDSIRRHIKRGLERAGIKKHASTHVFRHSYATHSLEEGYSPRREDKEWSPEAIL